MVITNDFVFLHFPKTGGTFCETHIMRLYKQRNRERLANLIQQNPVRWFHSLRKHAGAHAIPRYARYLPILSCIRNPYDQWVSRYEFKIYKHYPKEVKNLELIKQEYPRFPDVTFTEYIKLANKYLSKVQFSLGKKEEEKIGFYSAQFIGMFCPRPAEILRLPKAEITADLVRSKMVSNLTLLRTNNLNQELYNYLSRFNHKQPDLELILDSPKILPDKSGPGSLRPEDGWRAYYTREAVEIINDKESLIFDLFPQFKIETYNESWPSTFTHETT
jgi:hypothetical protein